MKLLLQSLLFTAVLAAGPAFAAAAPVNVNTADAAAIATAMKGVGLSKAEAIVAYRQTHGPFKSLEQLAEVKGIGLKTIDNNRDKLTVGAGATAPKGGAEPN